MNAKSIVPNLQVDITCSNDLYKFTDLNVHECIYVPSLNKYATLVPHSSVPYLLVRDMLIDQTDGSSELIKPGTEIIYMKVVRLPPKKNMKYYQSG